MKYIELMAFNFVLLTAAGAEPVRSCIGQGHPATPEQRRADLRSALRERRLVVGGQPAEASDSQRRLSDRERMDLRNQLRSQRQDEPLRAP